MTFERTITTQCGTNFKAIDTGAPDAPGYLTLVFLHGWGVPSTAGIANRIAELAFSQGVRFIGVNRRGYAGSTPYSPEETRVFTEGASDERGDLYRGEGRHYVYMLDTLIKDGSIGEGGVAFVAWSAGNSYLSSMIDAINFVPGEVRERVSEKTKAFIYYALHSLNRRRIAPADRYSAFLAWFASYFKHDLASRDDEKLGTRADPTRTPTDQEEHFYPVMTDLAGATPGDAGIMSPDFEPFVRSARDSAFFSEATWKAWGQPKISYVSAGASLWMMVWAAWAMEDEVKAHNALSRVTFKVIEEGNHYSLYDHPKETLQTFLACAK
ncbi:hypothetical protein BD626DRAFT_535935 [Schizophyllum amplum]|uniref:AB hydrolase-1 domain-containing protein n=1 Tax=Schizophyllum amplum TaxID=97359 RepID=A0A550CL97_9AGAR|nr:hypothetical protein BD626DRAFT_535935 [Auriculariopsis ampla]